MKPRRVLCLSGSLRHASANTAALAAAQRLAPAELELVLFDGLSRLPSFNPDDEVEPLPAAVVALRSEVGRADALLIASPEYAHGIPGAFKNLLDWLVGGIEFPHKPVLVLNTSARGSHHAQDALCEVLRTMSAHLLTAEPLALALPAADCTVDAILTDAESCRALQAILRILRSTQERDGRTAKSTQF